MCGLAILHLYIHSLTIKRNTLVNVQQKSGWATPGVGVKRDSLLFYVEKKHCLSLYI